MDLEMQYFQGPSQLKKAAQICISNRLFVDRWQLRKWFGKLREGVPCAYIDHIVIAYHQGTPIGVMTRSVMEKGDYLASFVRAKHRRLGVATAMLNYIPNLDRPWAMTGVDRDGNFWKNVDVLV